MKTLLTKIMLALLLSTLIALLLSTLLTRIALQRGFVHFLEQQESAQLDYLMPELVTLYQQSGSWERLHNNPRRWLRVLMQARPEGIRPSDFPSSDQPGRHREGFENGRPPARDNSPGTAARRGEAGRLWRRLFLLDADQNWIAGRQFEPDESVRMEPVMLNEQVVGWIGFSRNAQVLSPEGQRFLELQNRALMLTLLLAGGVAVVLGFLLARNLTRPVKGLRDTVRQLTAGSLDARAEVHSRDEIGQLAGHVNRLAETLEKNQSARRRWTADTAHELRTPIAILQGELDAIEDGVRPDTDATRASLRDEVSHLAHLVEDLQTLSLADAGSLTLAFETTDLAQLVRQALDIFSDRFTASGLKLEAETPDQLVVTTDERRCRQLLDNLLENANRYTDAGGQVRVVLRQAAREAVLEIEDSAPGVEPQHLEHLFERFYRAESSRGRSGGGTGLGLTICHNLAEALGGTITAYPSVLGGLGIRIRLPLDI